MSDARDNAVMVGILAHALRITLVVAGIVLCTLLPFLPGRYDSLAVPLSAMAQIFGRVGLLLVPVGALWLASGYWRPLARRQRLLAIAALIVSTLVWGIVSLVAAVFSGFSLSLIALVIWAGVVAKALRRLRTPSSGTREGGNAIALYLVVVPVAVALVQWTIAAPATEFSRSRAIRNSARLIADIEQYRTVNGRYPASLLSLWEDYSPSVIGIERFYYEPSGDAYNLLFEQFTFEPATREIVVYNPRDGQVATSHNMDLLQYSSAELELRRGYYAVHDARHPHWKYFWFD